MRGHWAVMETSPSHQNVKTKTSYATVRL